MTIFIAVIIVLDIIALCVIFFGGQSGRPDISADARPGADPETTQQVELFSRVSFVAVGDNLIHDTVYEQAAARSSGGYDFSDAYDRIAEKIETPDVAILNQETIISTEHNVSSYPMFNSPVEVGEEMLEIGFDVFNIATNHSVDCGEKGLISAINFWKSKNAITCGAYLNNEDMNNIPMNEVNGVRIAYLGFTDSTNGLSLPSDSDVVLVRAADESLLQQRIYKAKEKADVVVVSAHWGNEYTHEPNDAQRELAQKLASWGADVIIGTHPHVIQPVEYITNNDGRKTLVARFKVIDKYHFAVICFVILPRVQYRLFDTVKEERDLYFGDTVFQIFVDIQPICCTVGNIVLLVFMIRKQESFLISCLFVPFGNTCLSEIFDIQRKRIVIIFYGSIVEFICSNRFFPIRERQIAAENQDKQTGKEG